MTRAELEQIMRNIAACDDFLAGKKHPESLAKLAKAAADKAILERRENLLDRLRLAGLKLTDEEA